MQHLVVHTSVEKTGVVINRYERYCATDQDRAALFAEIGQDLDTRAARDGRVRITVVDVP